jgi:hypothetical protein
VLGIKISSDIKSMNQYEQETLKFLIFGYFLQFFLIDKIFILYENSIYKEKIGNSKKSAMGNDGVLL